jgi:hypothetical protein
MSFQFLPHLLHLNLQCHCTSVVLLGSDATEFQNKTCAFVSVTLSFFRVLGPKRPSLSTMLKDGFNRYSIWMASHPEAYQKPDT